MTALGVSLLIVGAIVIVAEVSPGAINELVPAAALLLRRLRSRVFIEICMVIVGVPGQDAVVCPTFYRVGVDAEALRHLVLAQHSSGSKPIVA